MEPSRFICEHCIQDAVLNETIRDGPILPTCYWCHAKQVRALPMGEMGHRFRDLVKRSYDSDELGEPIDVLLFDDWKIFSHRLKRLPAKARRYLILAWLRAGVRTKELRHFLASEALPAHQQVQVRS